MDRGERLPGVEFVYDSRELALMGVPLPRRQERRLADRSVSCSFDPQEQFKVPYERFQLVADEQTRDPRIPEFAAQKPFSIESVAPALGEEDPSRSKTPPSRQHR